MKIERIQIPSPLVRSVEQIVHAEAGTHDVDAVRFDEQSAGRRRREETPDGKPETPLGSEHQDGAPATEAAEHSREDGLKARPVLDIVA